MQKIHHCLCRWIAVLLLNLGRDGRLVDEFLVIICSTVFEVSGFQEI